MDVYEARAGSGPLVVSFPHSGEAVPENLAKRMTDHGRAVPDTDWLVPRLYGFVERRPDIGMVKANYSRYVIDLNRPPDGLAMYPGDDETGLCPTTTFAHQPIYLRGSEPGANDREQRITRYWQPFHDAVESQLAVNCAEHGYALLWDAHSIASQVPRFFSGTLPDFNFGTAGGQSCPGSVLRGVQQIANDLSLEHVANQRFKGGYITRRYGRPEERVFAIQLELSQRCYLNEGNGDYEQEKADHAGRTIERLLDGFLMAASSFTAGPRGPQ